VDIISPNLEQELLLSEHITQKCQNSKSYSQNLYAAICNNLFYKEGKEWSCSWRYSGGIIADLRDIGEDYLDFYCSGIGSDIDGYVGESFVTDDIREDLLKLEWTITEYTLSEQTDAI
jgi:hypothetical protein